MKSKSESMTVSKDFVILIFITRRREDILIVSFN